LLVRFASLAFRAPDVTPAFVRTLAVNGPTVSVVFCEWGWGWSNLWGDEGADRWAWFTRKILIFSIGKTHFVKAAEVEDIPRRYLYALEVCGIR
jgi:hypothetical protein